MFDFHENWRRYISRTYMDILMSVCNTNSNLNGYPRVQWPVEQFQKTWGNALPDTRNRVSIERTKGEGGKGKQSSLCETNTKVNG